ncbi:MAG TPA: LysR family transcriptional regulator [Ramlibacter sp.]|nr:LysR family transcriptional regulator [Ramlibacter sp.]
MKKTDEQRDLPTLRDLRILLTAVEAGSMSKAAELLRVSQPAISKTIGQIERAVDAQLITRSSTGIRPTAQGEVLLARGRAAFDELRRGIEGMKALSDPQSGELRIAGNQIAQSVIIPRLINRIYADHPGITFHVISAYTLADQVRELEQRNADLVVARLTNPLEDSGVQAIELLQDDFVVVAAPGNRWARRRNVELAELMDEPWTFPSRDSVSGRFSAQIFEATGLGLPRITVVASSIQLHRQLVMHSGYLGLFSRSFAESSRGIHILPVTLKGERQSIGILTARHRTLTPLTRLFIDYARAVFREDEAALTAGSAIPRS